MESPSARAPTLNSPVPQPFDKTMLSSDSRDALLQALDSELRLFEGMRRFAQARAKCDRDYSASLEGLVQLAQRLNCSSSESAASCTPLFTVWNKLVEETLVLAKKMQSRSDAVTAVTVERLAQFANDRAYARKMFGDEKTQIEKDFRKAQESVLRYRTEYNKVMDRVKAKRAECQELQQKGKLSKSDDARRKYVQLCQRAHNSHNEYVLSLKDMHLFNESVHNRTVPLWLSACQRHMESSMAQCKSILHEFVELTDLCADDFLMVHKNMSMLVQSIAPDTEYSSLVQQHGKGAELPVLAFDASVFQGYVGSLVPNELSVNTATSEPLLRSRISYGSLLAEAEAAITRTASHVKATTEGFNAMPNMSAIWKQLEIDNLNRRLEEHRLCHDRLDQLVKYVDEKLKAAAGTGTGGDAFPVMPEAQTFPNDDVSTSSVTRQTSSTENSDSPAVPGANRASGAEGQSTFSKMIMKIKSATDIKGSASKDASDGRQSDSGEPAQPSIAKRISSNSVKSDKDPTRSDSTATAVTASQQHARQEQLSYQRKQYEETTLRNEPCSPSELDEPRGQQLEQSEVDNTERALEDLQWFHGILPRDEILRLLSEDGDFLVRESKRRDTQETLFVLSVMWQGPKHFIIQPCEAGWKFEGHPFPSIQELINYQMSSSLPVTLRSQALLLRPIIRETWQLNNDHITLECKIGSGNFGDVFRGTYKGTTVAVKTCKEQLSEEQKKKFIGEGKTLRQYDHPNIVQFIGIAAQKNPVMIVMEYVSGGALLTWLRKHEGQPHRALISMCIDAAMGMEYLGTKNVIHRDLAARNCLVAASGTVKISDFGMSREEGEYIMAAGNMRQIPIKWTAPEALNYGRYTVMCDVWSYGILMWEVFSGGKNPYPGMRNQEAREKVDEGYRMAPPPGCPAPIYALMKCCWHPDAEQRPKFTRIVQDLRQLLPSL